MLSFEEFKKENTLMLLLFGPFYKSDYYLYKEYVDKYIKQNTSLGRFLSGVDDDEKS